MGLTAPLFDVLGHAVSGRDLILLGGGLFLIAKATWEIYDKLEADHARRAAPARRGGSSPVLAQILLLDIVFSLDSVITAVGMANHLSIMVMAMVIAMVVMLVSASPIGGFVERHPSVKILALSFLLLIGVMLVAEGMGSTWRRATSTSRWRSRCSSSCSTCATGPPSGRQGGPAATDRALARTSKGKGDRSCGSSSMGNRHSARACWRR